MKWNAVITCKTYHVIITFIRAALKNIHSNKMLATEQRCKCRSSKSLLTSDVLVVLDCHSGYKNKKYEYENHVQCKNIFKSW